MTHLDGPAKFFPTEVVGSFLSVLDVELDEVDAKDFERPADLSQVLGDPLLLFRGRLRGRDRGLSPRRVGGRRLALRNLTRCGA